MKNTLRILKDARREYYRLLKHLQPEEDGTVITDRIDMLRKQVKIILIRDSIDPKNYKDIITSEQYLEVLSKILIEQAENAQPLFI